MRRLRLSQCGQSLQPTSCQPKKTSCVVEILRGVVLFCCRTRGRFYCTVFWVPCATLLLVVWVELGSVVEVGNRMVAGMLHATSLLGIFRLNGQGCARSCSCQCKSCRRLLCLDTLHAAWRSVRVWVRLCAWCLCCGRFSGSGLGVVCHLGHVCLTANHLGCLALCGLLATQTVLWCFLGRGGHMF